MAAFAVGYVKQTATIIYVNFYNQLSSEFGNAIR